MERKQYVLTTKDRIILLNVLPAKGSFLTLKITRELRETLSFTEEELGRLKFVEDGNALKWETANDVPREFDFQPAATDIIKTALKGLDEKESLDADTFPLYELFIGE